ncbi:MAG: 50S ribosomal protein L18 [Candidatus Kerfeldbacteria bacterium CG_4_10_14_0_8_um_filter_42_10]|uniref:Large ribosomal subunit protein uL18 n=1 Tax=Candidatus Kerfeldbacteria bacterium CG_4_10_14_0_8_um_filter_42_10 TaxID=2014248 RepID=A0A2M7RI01_9BACT|nr:MAG: 50S ribosomal protein L18 [Candidatus Kerfeldbacteria bacterium CG_4_10_14_0_8_um_filter_42_10]
MSNTQKKKQSQRERRKKRIRAKILGTAERPRLCVFRSLKHIYAQIIDDQKAKVLVSANDGELAKKDQKEKKETMAKAVGKLIAQKASTKKIGVVVFDRGGFAYHGRIKALAEGAREGGLKF